MDHMGFLARLGLAGPVLHSSAAGMSFTRFFQVLQWKAQQEEAANLQAAVAARREEKKEEKERLRKEREMIRRAREKEKV